MFTTLQFLNGTASCQCGKDDSAGDGHGYAFLSTIVRFFIENTPRQHKHSAKKAIGASPLQFFDYSIEPALVRTARTID